MTLTPILLIERYFMTNPTQPNEKPAADINNELHLKKAVMKRYAEVAQKNSQGENVGIANSCCGAPLETDVSYSEQLGYSKEEATCVPEGANMGLGCGNPIAIATLEAGETVLDLGSGGGFDCFLAARQVGETGHVIGVDMTPAMIEKARINAQKNGYNHVEFR